MGKRRKRARRRRLATGAVVAVLACLTLLLVAANYAVATLPDVSHLSSERPETTALMRERGGRRIQYWVDLEDLSPRLIQAVIVAEDAGFYGHRGFDFHEIREAFKRNWEEGRTVRGASTITQQLAKNLFLSSDRSYVRKLKEAVLAVKLERALTKSRILELYLNVIEWGDGIYGAEAAARDVFGRSAKNLDTVQAATLAAMIPNPIRLHPCKSPESVRTRRDRILGYLHAAGKLSEIDLEAALVAAPRLRGCRPS